MTLTLTGVPNGAVRQNTRSTGQNSAGWEIEHWPHAALRSSVDGIHQIAKLSGHAAKF